MNNARKTIVMIVKVIAETASVSPGALNCDVAIKVANGLRNIQVEVYYV